MPALYVERSTLAASKSLHYRRTKKVAFLLNLQCCKDELKISVSVHKNCRKHALVLLCEVVHMEFCNSRVTY